MDGTDDNSSSPNPPTRKRWFRFSISTLLLVSVIVALGVSHWTSARDRLALERKLDQIRQDHDLLEIVDPDMIHVLPLPSQFYRMGQVRVYLPEGSSYRLNFHWRDVADDFDWQAFEWKEGVRKQEPHMPHSGKELQPGTYLIEYAIQYMPMQGSGRWVVEIKVKPRDYLGNIYSPLPWDAPTWLAADYVGNRDFRLNGDQRSHSISFWDRSGLKQGQVTQFSDVDEVTIVQTGVYNNAASLGALVIDPVTTDDVFRIWIERTPNKP